MKKILKNGYFQVGVLSFLLLSLIYILKGIYPFGNKLAMWSDLHEQITPMYYHFYDSFYSSNSIFVNFDIGGGVNFLGLLSYYILSPFTALLLLFPRDKIYEATSLIIMGKMVLSSITSYYYLNTYFKKVKNNYKILLSLLYTFSIYSLFYYSITAWMDGMYLFPLLLIGLKKLLDLEDNKFYIILLSFFLIFSFYTGLLSLLFIFFASFIYLNFYNKKNFKVAAYNLGVSTAVAFLIAGVVLVPTYMELMSSARTRLDISMILNSRLGPLVDKLALFLASAPLIVMTLLGLKNKKTFSKFLICLLFLTLSPVIIEPINKFLHLGSYMYLPIRFAFIPIFLLVIGSAYYLENRKESTNKSNIGLILTLLTTLVTIFSLQYLDFIKKNINRLTFSYDKKSFLILFVVFFFVFVTFYFLLKKKNKYNTLLINFLIIFNILFNLSIFIGGYTEPDLRKKYELMTDLTSLKTSPYRLKFIEQDLVLNYGMVTKTPNFTQFSAMINKNTYDTMQKFGYDSYSVDTQSIGGNIFMDTVLGNRYILTHKDFENPYYKYKKSISGMKLYENEAVNFGYIIKGYLNKLNNDFNELYKNSSFDNTNIVYDAITGNGKIIESFKLKEDNYNYKKGEIIEEVINIKEKGYIYLELFKDFDFQDKNKVYGAFKIYVNDKLVEDIKDKKNDREYPNLYRNGNVFLGEFSSSIKIKIEVLKDVSIRKSELGILLLSKYEKFIKDNKIDTKVTFNKNKININVEGKKGDYLFLPINYLEGFKSTHNIDKVFGNFFLVKLNEGVNDIEISYVSKGFYIGLIVTIIGIISFILFNKFNKPILENAVATIYNGLFYFLFGVIYLIGLLAFFVSFIYRFI